MSPLKFSKKQMSQASFSLIETVMAVGLVATILLEVSGVQGNAIYFSTYNRNVSQAIWLAKHTLSQIEHNYYLVETNQKLSFKDLNLKETDRPYKIEDMEELDFKINATIEEWKLPIMDMLTGGIDFTGSGKDDDKEEKDDDPENGQADMSGMIEGVMKQIFGDEPPMKIAKVEISWPEGAVRGSVDLSLVLSNTKKLNEFLYPMVQKYIASQNRSKKQLENKRRQQRRRGNRNRPPNNNPTEQQPGGESGDDGV